MKLHLLTKAALFDGMDSSSKSSPKNKSNASISTMAHQLGIDDPDIIDYLVNKTHRDPSLRLPDNVYSSLDADARTQWHGFSDDAKRAFVHALNQVGRDSELPSNRKAHSHESRSPSYDDTQLSTEDTLELTDTESEAPSVQELEDFSQDHG